jgi:hypothetical protein
MMGPYRETPAAAPDPYLAAWSRLRRRRIVLRASIVGFFVLIVPSVAASALALSAGMAIEVRRLDRRTELQTLEVERARACRPH